MIRSLESLAQRGGFFDGDWVESKDQDPQGEIRLLQLADVGDGEFRDRSDRRINTEVFVRLRCSPLSAGDILIARMPDPLGRACQLPAEQAGSITVVDVAVLRVSREMAHARYVMYAINSAPVRSAVDAQQDGATRQRIPRKKLGKIAVELPPLPQQGAIVDYLDRETAKIDTLIEKQTTMIERLHERRSAVISTAVADRGNAVTLASLSKRSGFFDGDWVESKDQDPEGEIRLLQLADVGDGQFRDRSDRRVSAATFARLRCSALRADDILIARMPDPLGRACLLPSDQSGSITVVDVAVLRVDHAKAVPKYVMYAVNSAAARSAIEVQQDGATRQRIPRKKLGKIALPVPPLHEQRKIADYLDRETAKIDSLIAKVERHIELAKERRAALITAAVTGQIDVTTTCKGGDAA